MDELRLRYGINPHQQPARAFVDQGSLPFRVLNGEPGFINLLDALNSWQLVRELKELSGLPAAASFKHVSPAGAAIGKPLSEELACALGVEANSLSPLAAAYVRARGADPMSSFGDWAALSDTVDISTASLLRREVSDGCIAPGYEPAALELLRKKKEGRYPILEIQPDYSPPSIEVRQVFGVWLEQSRNDARITPALLENTVTRNRTIPEQARLDLLLATLVVKYTQSNSICVAWDGQAIGVGAGQQSRIACTRIACDKAERWLLRLHPRIRSFQWTPRISRQQKAMAVECWLDNGFEAQSIMDWRTVLKARPEPLSAAEKEQWLARFQELSLSSDAFIPFRDNIDRAVRSGIRYIIQTGGSTHDADVIKAADEHGIAMIFTGIRLFHH
ncbi:MAG: phosphoribosylaminoimidazolecarboxamide formyltransferase [candidate division WOR-3 bacterium]